MSKPAASPESVLMNRLFMTLHGYYGAQFLDKWRTGEVTASGADRGVENAKQVWAVEVSKFSDDELRGALRLCRERSPKFAPSLPEFLEFCRASRPVIDPARRLKHEAKKRTPETEQRVRETLKVLRERVDSSVSGLPRLLALVADAIECGGETNKGAVLRRLEQRVVRTP